MRGVGRRSLVILTAIASLASSAWAQVTNSEEPSTDGTSPDESPVERSPESPVVDEALVARLLQRLDALRTENEQLRERLDLLEEDHAYLEQKVSELAPVAAKVTGFLDVGFFSVTGDGSGIRLDVGNRHFPEYRPSAASGHSWVFMGDPLSTAVNARGEPATTAGLSRAIALDGIKGRASSFLVNTLNVGLFAEVGDHVVFTAKVDVLPRGRDVSDFDGLFLGDYLDVRLAYLEYRIERPWMKLELFAGKFDSVIGFEYRSQEAPTRIEVTPSLICRYTCGYPIGLKARARWLDDALTLNVAVTNGSHFSEGFPFYDEVDSNHVKTLAGRVSYQVIRGLELGASGMLGAQDNQPRDDVYQWLFGFDMHYHQRHFVLRAEYVQGRADGVTEPTSTWPCDETPCIEFKGLYGLLGLRLTNVVMPYLRGDWRDALHEHGASFVYISKLFRVTPGLRLDLTENLVLKAEYTFNRELGGIPQFPNDVFTSALVVKY